MMEKKSGLTTKALAAVAKFINDNPRLTLGLLAGGVVTAYGANKITGMAKNIHPLDQMIKERQKLSLLNQQNQMMASLLKSNIDIRNSVAPKPASNKIYPPLS
jgi:hypothetical protein